MKKKEIYLVPYSHLDTQWRWEYPTTIKKYLKNTMNENFDRLEKYPEHHFNFTGALRYQMMKEYYPEEYEKVKVYIKEGRWHLAGTCLDETDALIPSVESSIRNILYGNLWQLEEFGKTSKDYMIPDCFGFPANLPSVMAHCGINGFSSNKLTWDCAVGIPFEIGKWEGPDGSEIVSAFNPCRYDSHLKLPIYINHWRLKRLNTLGKSNNIWKSFQYYGVGDIGGAPKEGSVKRAIKSIRHYEKKDKDIVVRQGAADQFFDEITSKEKDRMDRYAGDLLLVNHSAGTLTSAAIMKRWNRKNEQLAFAAEAAAVMAWCIAGLSYPNDKIKKAWQRVIGNQMHDILPGTSTPIAYQFSQNDEVLALNSWLTILEDSARALVPYIQGDGKLVLFNPYEGRRHELVTVVMENLDVNKQYQLVDCYGKSYSAQITQNKDNNQLNLTFKPEMEAFSWSRYSIEKITMTSNSTDLKLVKEPEYYVMENKYYKLTITTAGKVRTIFDKIRQKELIKSPIAYEFQKERPMKFPAWNMDWRDRKKKPYLRIEEGGKVEVIEDGCLKKTLRITYNQGGSVLVKDIILGADDDKINFIERIHWRETGCSLKLALETTMTHPEFTYNWETSRRNRGVNREKQFEVPSRLWVDISQENFGFSLVEDSKYGYDRPNEGTLRMTLLYTPAIRYYNGFWDQKSHDWGEHTIRYAIKSHDGSWTKTDDMARQFNQPVRSFLIESEDAINVKETVKSVNLIHSNDAVKSVDSVPSEGLGLFAIDNPQIGVLSVKKAEAEAAMIIRLYERYGKDVLSNLVFLKEIDEVYEINGLEQNLNKIEHHNKVVNVNMKANGIYALKVTYKDMPKKLRVNQTVIDFDCNTSLIGANGETGNAIFPKELILGKIEAGAIIFGLNRETLINAIMCQGNTVNIPRGYNRLSLLGGAEGKSEAIFEWLDKKGKIIEYQQVNVPSLTGFVGQWDTRTWKKEPTHLDKLQRDYAWINRCTGVSPGYVNRNRIEWYSTHIHQNGEDRAYKYGYMNHIQLSIPKKAVALKLPNNKSIKFVAMTAWDSNVRINSNQYLNDNFDF